MPSHSDVFCQTSKSRFWLASVDDRGYADLDLGPAELRVRDGDPQVAGEHEFERGAEAVSVDHRGGGQR